MKPTIMLRIVAAVLLASLFISGCKTPLKIASIEVDVLRGDQTRDEIEISGLNFPPNTPLAIEGYTTGAPRNIGLVNSDSQGAFKTRVLLTCSGATRQEINIQVYPRAGGGKAFAKTGSPVCF